MSNEIQVIFNEDLLAYPDGFTRCEFKKGSKYSLPKKWVLIHISAGRCYEFLERQTKPAPIIKETKTINSDEPKTIKKTGPVKRASSKRITKDK
jgi:hypothetical protein